MKSTLQRIQQVSRGRGGITATIGGAFLIGMDAFVYTFQAREEVVQRGNTQ